MKKSNFFSLSMVTFSAVLLSSTALAQVLPVTSPEYDAAVTASATELIKDVSEFRGYDDLKLDPTKPITFKESTYTVTDSNPAYLTDVHFGEISFSATSAKLPGGSFSATIRLDANINGTCTVDHGTYLVTKASNPLVRMAFQQDLMRFGNKVVEAFVNASDIKRQYCH